MLEDCDAALMIGDPAMNISSEEFHVFDLANLWHQFTNTGFVFAMWMTRAETQAAISKVDFAGDRGVVRAAAGGIKEVFDGKH